MFDSGLIWEQGAEEKVGVDYLPDIECHSGVNWAELAVSRLGQLQRHASHIASEHRYFLPTHNLHEVAVVHAHTLHLGSSRPPKSMDTLVRYPEAATPPPDHLKYT